MHEDFKNKVKDIWDQNVVAKTSLDKWLIKEKRIKNFLKGRGNKKGDDKKKKRELQEELMDLEIIEESLILNSDQLQRKTEIQTNLMFLLEQEELYRNERSNNNWLLKGDGNTEFFHRVANGKKRKNTILSLQCEDRIIEEDDKLLEHATAFYKTLFGPEKEDRMKLDPQCWAEEEKVNGEENKCLTDKFTEEQWKKYSTRTWLNFTRNAGRSLKMI